MFNASVEEISDSDSQFSFSNEESSSMHVRYNNAIKIICSSAISDVYFHVEDEWNSNEQFRNVFACMFQDTNEAEADNTDKEGDFNLKVSIERERACTLPRYIFTFFFFIVFLVTSWSLEEPLVKKKNAKRIASRFFFVSVAGQAVQFSMFSFLFFHCWIMHDHRVWDTHIATRIVHARLQYNRKHSNDKDSRYICRWHLTAIANNCVARR